MKGFSVQAPEETIGKPPNECCHPDDRKIVTLGLQKGGPIKNPRVHHLSRDGEGQTGMWLETLISPIRTTEAK